jgi:uncharacterized protein (DUF433 family)
MEALSLTTSEAGYVLECSPLAINKAVDTGLIRAVTRRGPAGHGTLRILGKPELRFLKLADVLDKTLTLLGQRKIYEAMRRLPEQQHQHRLGVLTVELLPLDRAIEERLGRLMALRSHVETPTSGEPVIRGTTVPVYVVASLAKGETIEEILEDYPSLTRAQVENAIEYAKAYPKKGRPYPARSFKRVVANMGLDDIATNRTREGPRLIQA